jgi:hypothetical protein
MSRKSRPTIHHSAMPAPTPIAEYVPVLSTVSGCLDALDKQGWTREPVLALRAIYKSEKVQTAEGTVDRHGRTATRMTAEAVYPWSPREFQSVKALAKCIAGWLQSATGTSATAKGEDSVRAQLQAHGVSVEVIAARTAALARRNAPADAAK